MCLINFSESFISLLSTLMFEVVEYVGWNMRLHHLQEERERDEQNMQNFITEMNQLDFNFGLEERVLFMLESCSTLRKA